MPTLVQHWQVSTCEKKWTGSACGDAAALAEGSRNEPATAAEKAVPQAPERKQHFGELVQMDGSFHLWLEERGGEGCLMHMVDDASGQAEGEFSREETIWAAAKVLRHWIEQYGVPGRCIRTGRTCMCNRRACRRRSAGKSRKRSLDACAQSWGFVLSRPTRRRPKDE